MTSSKKPEADGRGKGNVERAGGPGILFFSGGSALSGLSSELTRHTSNSMHIVTTFDSGGSSARLREAFDMPAVGDIRNRLIALADGSREKCSPVIKLLSHRLPREGARKELVEEIHSLAEEEHRLMKAINPSIRRVVAKRFRDFLSYMPESFDPRGASFGNLILASGYIQHKRVLAPAIAQFSRYACVSGVVRACSLESGHLAVRLKNGEIIAGQHKFTGKEAPPVSSPIDGVWVCSGVDDPWPRAVYASSIAMLLIMEADLIVYPMGSFYSSLLAALLPKDMGHSISANPSPKVFIPNMGHDPELAGHSVALQVSRLLEVVRSDNPFGISVESVLDAVLVDSRNGSYEGGLDIDEIEEMGVRVIDRQLVSDDSNSLVDPELLSEILMDIAINGISG